MKNDNRKKDSPTESRADDEAPVTGEAEGEEAAPAPEASGELEELKTRLAYLAAEFDNYRKRAAREKESLVAFGNEKLLRAILPFLDNLERAMAQAAASGSIDGLQAGVRLTYDQALSDLKKFGLEQLSAEGEAFDPARHEAIAQTACEGKEEGTVLSEARKGYLLNGRLLRPAQVIVAQAPPAAGRGNGRDPDSPDTDN
ncbi:MAG: nucleotide exchange factor GrpE [Deltaproteobacteria bacterium]|nr:nucleotide exchange factor GrpE [Deltaproteobacteria bacterium]